MCKVDCEYYHAAVTCRPHETWKKSQILHRSLVTSGCLNVDFTALNGYTGSEVVADDGSRLIKRLVRATPPPVVKV